MTVERQDTASKVNQYATKMQVVKQAIVLCGGKGTRLRPVVNDRPKPLAEVKGIPFIGYILDHLSACGIERLVLSTGYLGEHFSDIISNYQHAFCRLDAAQEPHPMGTGGAIYFAKSQLPDEHFLIVNGDSLCRFALPVFEASYLSGGPNFSMAVTKMEDISRFGSVDIERGTDKVTGFSEKGQSGAGLVNTGVYLSSHTFLDRTSVAGACSLENTLFEKWLGHGLRAHRVNAPLLDIGTPEDFLRAQTDSMVY